MKRFLTILLLFVTVVAVTGCDDETETPAPVEETAPSADQAAGTEISQAKQLSNMKVITVFPPDRIVK